MRSREVPSPSQSPNLDFLRSVAVLLVVYCHVVDAYSFGLGLDPWSMGRLGVLIFFVHTSLVLMLSLERQQARREQLFRSFYIRRIFRIYPAAIVCVILAVVYHLLLRGSGYRPVAWTELLSNLLLIQNLTGSRNLHSVLWSLPYEIQMYVVLPALYLLVSRYRTPWVMFGAWVIACGLSLAFPQIYGLRFIPCFIGGILAYQLPRKQYLPGILWPVFIAAIIALFVCTDRQSLGWITCLVLGAGIPQFREIPFKSVTTAAHYVAKYSYGIYLIHEPIVRIGFKALAFLPAPLRLIATLVVVAAGSVAVYRFIEAPMIAMGAGIVSRYKSTSGTEQFVAAATQGQNT